MQQFCMWILSFITLALTRVSTIIRGGVLLCVSKCYPTLLDIGHEITFLLEIKLIITRFHVSL